MNAKDRIMNLVKQGVITTEEALILLENEQQDSEHQDKDEKKDYLSKMKVIDDKMAQVESEIDMLSSLELIAPLNQEQEEQMNRLEEELKQLNEDKNHCNEEEAHDKWKSVKEEAMNQASDLVQQVGTLFKKTSSQVQTYLKEASERQKELRTPKYFNHTYDFDDDYIQTMNIEVLSGNITVQPWEGNHVKVDVQAKLFTLEDQLEKFFLEKSILMLDGHQLFIQAKDRGVAANLNIYVPQQKYSQIKINNDNGQIEVKQLMVDELNIKNIHGEVTIQEVEASLAEIYVTNGKIYTKHSKIRDYHNDIVNGNIDATGQFVCLNLEGTNSDITVHNHSDSVEEMTQRTVNGNINVYINNELPFALNAFTKYGSITHQLSSFEVIEEEENRTGHVLKGNCRHNERLVPAFILSCESKTGIIDIQDQQSKGAL